MSVTVNYTNTYLLINYYYNAMKSSQSKLISKN